MYIFSFSIRLRFRRHVLYQRLTQRNGKSYYRRQRFSPLETFPPAQQCSSESHIGRHLFLWVHCAESKNVIFLKTCKISFLHRIICLRVMKNTCIFEFFPDKHWKWVRREWRSNVYRFGRQNNVKMFA